MRWFVIGLAIAMSVLLLMVIVAPSAGAQARCGNGVREGAEECDAGQAGNSDSRPNACRTNCERAHCGDGVVDSGEACDDGAYELGAGWPYNHDRIPGACRTSCSVPRCGDGIVDFSTGEQCDNRVNDGRNGCWNCRDCYGVFDGQVISQSGLNARLCPGEYMVADPGRDGVIQITGDNVILDCAGVQIAGVDPTRMQHTQRPARTVATQPGSPASASPRTQSAQPVQRAVRPGAPIRAPGVGIVVTGRNVTLINCSIESLALGVRFAASGGTLIDSRICNTAAAIEAVGGRGVRNACSGVVSGWSEAGAACSSDC